MTALEQYEKDMASLADLNERFYIRIMMKAAFAPFPVEAVPVDQIPERITRYSIITKSKS
jgi:hypothetical protein